ncbi:MAG: NAD(P)-dependent alcohol dehydrogenase [Sedimentisphaerales bacterium]|nr:NAD(P)-dependent alcohol dehydrogenase [Sedimentisphaerales bacterium]
MKAIVYERYGPPEVLRIDEVEKPVPGDDEVLIRVCATTVTTTDCTFRRGKPFPSRLYTGLIRPKHAILGDEFAGEIDTVGTGVKRFKAGDQVFGTCVGHGAYAEYICLSEEAATLASKPSNLTYDEAVACCDGFLTALPFLRDKGKIRSGQKVVINGASGSVGTAAVQLANYFGAEVTGVCSTANLDLVRSLGADRVIDYTREDFTRNGRTFDIIFDTVGKVSFSRCKRALMGNGVFLEAAIGLAVLPQVLWTSRIGSKKAVIAATGLRPASERTKDLVFLRGLLESGQIKPVIDRRYPFEQIVEAHRYVEQGHKKGNVVITL